MSVNTNQPAVIDEDRFIVRRTITIAAPVSRVWAALTEPELISRWFGDRTELESVEPGTTGVFSWDEYGDVPVLVVEVDAPRMIAYRWGNGVGHPVDDAQFDAGASTVFRFTLEEIDGGTQLTVVESGFENVADPASNMESNRGGWTSELDELVAFLES